MKTIIKQYFVWLCTLCVSMCHVLLAYGENVNQGNHPLASAAAETSVTYEKVTTAPTDWSGDYLIVYEDGTSAKIFNGGLTTLDAAGNFVTANISSGKITMSNTNAQFTIAKSGDSYTVKSASGYYIGMTSKNTNALYTSQTPDYTNSIELSGTNVLIKDTKSAAPLAFYLSGNSSRFRYYGKSTQKSICLYKNTTSGSGGGDTPVKTLTALALSGSPTTTTYEVGDEFDKTGLVLTATYSDGSSANVTSNNAVEWLIDPETFTTAGQVNVSVMAGIGDIVTDEETYTVTVTAPKTLTDVTLSGMPSKTTYEQYESFDKTGLIVTATYSDGSTQDVTASATWEIDPATFETAGQQTVYVSATYNGKSDVQEYEVTVSESAYLFAKKGTFDNAVEGQINNDVKYETDRGGGTSSPALKGSDLLLYQNNSGTGGNYITLYGASGVTIEEVTLYVVNDTKIGFVEGEVTDNYPTSGQSVSAGGTYTKSNLNCTRVNFFCMGSDKNSRLVIDSIIVKYTKTEIHLQSISVSVPEATLQQRINTTFSHQGVVVTATYDNGTTLNVTDLATFSEPDMTTAGEKTVTVTYTEDGITKQTTYTINVYTPDYLFYESFNSTQGKGGNDGVWNDGGGGTVVYDNAGWTSKGTIYNSNACVRVGDSSASGVKYITTPAIEFEGMAKLTFRAAPWLNDATKLRVSVTEGKVSTNSIAEGATSIILETAEKQWTDFTLYLSGVETSTKINFEWVNSTKNRFYLDEVKVVAYTPSPLSSITLSGTPTTTYEVGETFDRAGIVATAHFEDESEEIVTNSCTWTIEPETLTTAGTANVSVTAAIGGKSATQSYQVTVTRKEASIAIEDLEVGVNGTVAIEATTTPEEAELTFQITEGQDLISIADGVITGLQVGTATVKALFAGNDEYAPAETTFTVAVDAYQVASITEFTKNSPISGVTGSFGQDNAIAYQGYKGSASTDPDIFNKCLRLYQATTSGSCGGYIELTGTVGVTIKQVTITTGTSYNTTVGVAVDEEAAPTSGTSVNKSSDFTVSGLSCESVRLYCMGADKNSRLDIAAITVKYEKSGITLESISVDVTNATTQFVQNTTFNHTGAVVTAHFSNGETQDVTSLATFSTPDMETTGDATITVTYNGKTASYGITIIPEVVSSLALSGNYPTRFNFGVDYIHAGMTVTATYNSGRTADVTTEAEYSAPDMDTPGRQTVTITFGGKEVTYQILVLDPAVVFYESFDLCTGKGGNDGEWVNGIGSATTKTDNEGWEFVKDGAAYQCVKLGTGSKAGSATTPEVYLSADDSYVLTFRAAAWLSDETNKSITLTATNAELSTTTIELENGVWNNYAVAIKNVQGAVKITFASVVDGANRFFLDEVKVSNGYQRAIDLTGVSNKWGTLCLNQCVAPEERSGAQFYNVAAVILDGAPVVVGSPDNRVLTRGGYAQVVGILLEEETDTLEAGKPYIFNAYAPTLACAFHGLDYATEAIPATGLVGNLTGTDMTVADGNYLLGNNQFHLVNGADAYIGNNRAYISLNGVPAVLPSTEMAANQVRFFLDGTIEGDYTTAIEGLEQTATANGTVFNLQGQRTNELQRGQLYIRNGKTFVVK